MGVKPLEYRQFLEQRSLPVPQDVAKAANRQSSTGMHRLSSCGTTRSRSPPSNRGSMAEF